MYGAIVRSLAGIPAKASLTFPRESNMTALNQNRKDLDMNSKRVAGVLFLLVLLCAPAQAKAKDGFGVGIIVGEPTGLSVKKWIASDRAIDAGIGWSFSENASFHLHMDYLFHRLDLLSGSGSNGTMPLYFGLGARVKLKEENEGKGDNDEDPLVGVRIPFGVTFVFRDAPFDLFAEIVPVLDLVPDSDFRLNAAIGTRFYF